MLEVNDGYDPKLGFREFVDNPIRRFVNFLERLLRILVHRMTGTWHLSRALHAFDNPSYHLPCVKS